MQRTFLLSLITLPVFASAQITEIGPFAGEAHEGWETHALGGPHQSLSIFGGLASVEIGTPSFIVTDSWTFFSSITPHQGNQFMGSVEGGYDYIFNTPAHRFGGYFATISQEPGAFIRFYDVNNVQIGSTMAIAAPDAAWEWDGWESTVAIHRAHVNTSSSFGHLMVDSLEYSSVPEPAAIVGIGLGLGVLCLRRKRLRSL